MDRTQTTVVKWVGAFLLLFCSFSYSNAQEVPVVTNPTFYDDTYVHVPLQFGFPFYGRTFTNSWMHSNGVVSFLDPMAPIPNAPYNPAQWAYCCEGLSLVPTNPQLGPQFNYMIAPLWTDLYPVGNSTFRTEGTSTYQKYFWNNIAEISNMNNLNTFSLEIRPTGYIGVMYDQIRLQNQNVTAGITGDIGLGQMQQFYYGTGISGQSLQNWSVANTPGDVCASNPLSSPSCPGYTDAMCSTNPLYSTSCSGYQQAFLTQQCSANPLYSPQCPGYAAAYLTYQCSLDPLYSTTCEGYETAYFNQQCSINPLYSINCLGYADAFYVQQCTADPLYDKGCTGYAEAYALKYVIAGPTATTTSATIIVATNTISDPVAQAAPLVSDPVVNQSITTTTTSASPSQPVAPVQLVPAPQPVATVAAAKTEEKKEEKKTESAGSSSTTTTTTTSTDNKDQPKTNRQALAERRLEAARAKAVEDGKQLAGKMGEAATMEAQVAVQNVVLQAMGFTPGFDAYGKVLLPDVAGYKPFEIYKGQRNIDNPLGRRLMTGSDRLHNEMVDMQYNR